MKVLYVNRVFKIRFFKIMQIKIKTRRKRLRTSDTSTTNLRYLSREELIQRVKNAQNQKKEAIRHASKLNKIIQKEVETEGVELNKEQNET